VTSRRRQGAAVWGQSPAVHRARRNLRGFPHAHFNVLDELEGDGAHLMLQGPSGEHGMGA
jgi:hypothetical protein